MKILAVIPARYNSSRFPGKPLALINKKSLLEHVYTNTKKSSLLDEVIIATEDQRIMDLAKKIGAKAMMTSDKHPSGTDRVVEVAKKYTDYDIILNIQGDEPQIDNDIIEKLCEPLKNNQNIDMTTLKKKITKIEEIHNHNVVKVVTTHNNIALYFSRSTIPFSKNKNIDVFKHIGLYGFKRNFLLKYSDMPMTQLEKTESLEQLRVLENGFKIYVNTIEKEVYEVNIPEDINILKKFI